MGRALAAYDVAYDMRKYASLITDGEFMLRAGPEVLKHHFDRLAVAVQEAIGAMTVLGNAWEAKESQIEQLELDLGG